MYGFIHCCLEDLVLKMFGDETWKEILKRSGIKLRGASFLMHKVYDDEVTLKLIITTSEVVGLDIETCLDAFGSHFLKYCQKNGYDKVLRVLGSNLCDFLTNLDNLHDHLSSIYPGMRAPSFRVTHTTDGTMHLHYYSERKGLSAIVKGLVKIVSKEFFNTEVVVKTLDENSEGHVILEVVPEDNNKESKLSESLSAYKTELQLSSLPKDLLFSAPTLCEAFPFHMIFRRDFEIIQIGNSLKRLSNFLWMTKEKPKFSDLFVISRPKIQINFESILNYCNQAFVVQSTDQFIRVSDGVPNSSDKFKDSSANQSIDNSDSTVPNLRLKGQMVPLYESDSILFLCSPRVNGLDEMKRLGLYMTDIPIHDRTRDLILMSHQRRGERELVEKLDEATNHIRILDTKLRDENKRTEEILHNIFPAKIARLLCQNIRLEAESFEPVTCLFSDIVGFTSMCGHPRVEPMDVVRLLNKLYIQFDNLTNIYEVYKVETIGDAYVVVGGLPEQIDDHADRVVQMALAMVKVTFNVQSPVDGKHIQMRIGIHSGSCMAGIVGLQMPRYCLFGNTVTLANKMESHSEPGQVHISEETRRHLIRDKYFFTDCPQKTLPFSSYFVTKIDDNYNEDYSLSVHNSLSFGGHFRSPSCSPTHTPLANSMAGTPLGGTPIVSPYVSPRGSPTRKHSIYDLFDRKSKQNISKCRVPDVKVNLATPQNSGQNETTFDGNSHRVNGTKATSDPTEKSDKKQKLLTFVSDLRRSSNTSHNNEQNNELIITEKVNKSLDTNQLTNKTERKTKDKNKKRKRYLILFCFRTKHREQNNSLNQISSHSNSDLSQQNIANKMCIQSITNPNNRIEVEDIDQQSISSVDGMDANTSTTSPSTARPVNYKEKKRKEHRMGCCVCQ